MNKKTSSEKEIAEAIDKMVKESLGIPDDPKSDPTKTPDPEIEAVVSLIMPR